MKVEVTKEWAIDALVRAVRTGAQVALSYLTVGMTIADVEWGTLLSVAVVAMVYSILMSLITGLPESKSDGTLVIDDSNEELTSYRLEVDTPLDDVSKMKSIRLNVSNRR